LKIHFEALNIFELHTTRVETQKEEEFEIWRPPSGLWPASPCTGLPAAVQACQPLYRPASRCTGLPAAVQASARARGCTG